MTRFDPRLLACLLAVACGPSRAVPKAVQRAVETSDQPPAPPPQPPRATEGPVPSAAEQDAMIARSAAALKQGQRFPAEDALSRCLGRDPLLVRCELQLARVLETIPRRKAHYRDTLRRAAGTDDPAAAATTYDEIVRRLRVFGEFQAAEQAARLALAREETADRQAALSVVLQALPGHTDAAVGALQRALEIDPERSKWAMELATLAARDPARLTVAAQALEIARTHAQDPVIERQLAQRLREINAAIAQRESRAPSTTGTGGDLTR